MSRFSNSSCFNYSNCCQVINLRGKNAGLKCARPLSNGYPNVCYFHRNTHIDCTRDTADDSDSEYDEDEYNTEKDKQFIADENEHEDNYEDDDDEEYEDEGDDDDEYEDEGDADDEDDDDDEDDGFAPQETSLVGAAGISKAMEDPNPYEIGRDVWENSIFTYDPDEVPCTAEFGSLAADDGDKDLWLVEAVMGHKGTFKRKKSLSFRIKWLGFEEMTWEPWENLCTNSVVHEYLSQRGLSQFIPDNITQPAPLNDISRLEKLHEEQAKQDKEDKQFIAAVTSVAKDEKDAAVEADDDKKNGKNANFENWMNTYYIADVDGRVSKKHILDGLSKCGDLSHINCVTVLRGLFEQYFPHISFDCNLKGVFLGIREVDPTSIIEAQREEIIYKNGLILYKNGLIQELTDKLKTAKLELQPVRRCAGDKLYERQQLVKRILENIENQLAGYSLEDIRNMEIMGYILNA